MEKSNQIEKPKVWSTIMLYSAIDWWQRNGSFDKELYEKIIQIKYNIEINTK
jgi:hypothetical protein